MQLFELKRQVGLLDKDVTNQKDDSKNLWDELGQIETEIKSELKEINSRINELPEKIVKLIKGI